MGGRKGSERRVATISGAFAQVLVLVSITGTDRADFSRTEKEEPRSDQPADSWVGVKRNNGGGGASSKLFGLREARDPDLEWGARWSRWWVFSNRERLRS